MILQLGPKARFFYDPFLKIKVLPGKPVEVSKITDSIKRALKGGHLVIVGLNVDTTKGEVKNPIRKVEGLSSTEEKASLYEGKKLNALNVLELDKFHKDLFIYAEDQTAFDKASKTKKVSAIRTVLELHDKCQELLALKPEQLESKSLVEFAKANPPLEMADEDVKAYQALTNIPDMIEFVLKQFPLYTELF
jgi:hypothetical protein